MTGRKDNAAAAARRQGTGGKKMPLSVRIGFLMILVMAAVFLPSTILISVCLLPSFVAALIDYRPQKTAWLTVGALNFAGIVPAWFRLWEQGHSVETAIDLLGQPQTLLVAYGAAAAGWLVFLQVPPLVGGVLAGKADKRLKLIAKHQSELVQKWGRGVSGEEDDKQQNPANAASGANDQPPQAEKTAVTD